MRANAIRAVLNLVLRLYTCVYTLVYTAVYHGHAAAAVTVLLFKHKLFISGYCPVLVLTTVLRRPRHDDIKKEV